MIISRDAPFTKTGEGNHAVAGGNGSGLVIDDYPSIFGSNIPVVEGSPLSPPPAPQRLPTNFRPTTGTPRLTPGRILALESTRESAARLTRLALPRASQPTSALTPEGKSSEPASTSDRPTSPPRRPLQLPAQRGQFQGTS